jgi:hypothetical protein
MLWGGSFLPDSEQHVDRDKPSFAQRFDVTLSGNGSRMTGQWEKAVDGGPWERDSNVEYARI